MLTMMDSKSLWQNWAMQGIEQLEQYRRDGRVGFVGPGSHNVDTIGKMCHTVERLEITV